MPTPWRREPFRLFFPLGVVIAWVGIGHWLLYAVGVTQTYSCLLHGLVQMQGFMMAFAVGFLLTAVPRRTRTPPPSASEMALLATALVVTTAAGVAERWIVAEAAYVTIFVLVLRFAVRRFLGGEGTRPPPAAFVLVPFALLYGVAGGGCILAAVLPGVPGSLMALGRLLVEQGVFLCLAVGIGGLVLPLMAGATPPADLGMPGEGWKAVLYAAAGILLGLSLALEFAGWDRLGPLLRAGVVAAGLALGGGAWRPPRTPGLHRRLVWVAVWLVPSGLVASALWPSYRVPALHVLFIGGFSLMAFGVATHVALGHLGLEDLALGRPRAVVILGATFLLALCARLAADASNTYFDHLGWAAALWIAGSAVWLAFLAPYLLGRA